MLLLSDLPRSSAAKLGLGRRSHVEWVRESEDFINTPRSLRADTPAVYTFCKDGDFESRLDVVELTRERMLAISGDGTDFDFT